MDRLSGKTALITGGTSGIGLATVKQFVAEGARVVTTGANPETITRAQAELGEDVAVWRADSLDLAAQRTLVEKLKDRLGPLDIVFLNAGISSWRAFEDWDEESFDRLFAINVKAPFFLMQALVPILANPASVIINASNSAVGGFAQANAYAASKAAVGSLARSWSADLLEAGVRVNTISPGPVDTPLYDKLGIPTEYHETAMNQIRSGIPAGRFGDPIEIAHAVVFLASDESRFTIGSDLTIDGGATILN